MDNPQTELPKFCDIAVPDHSVRRAIPILIHLAGLTWSLLIISACLSLAVPSTISRFKETGIRELPYIMQGIAGLTNAVMHGALVIFPALTILALYLTVLSLKQERPNRKEVIIAFLVWIGMILFSALFFQINVVAIDSEIHRIVNEK